MALMAALIGDYGMSDGLYEEVREFMEGVRRRRALFEKASEAESLREIASLPSEFERDLANTLEKAGDCEERLEKLLELSRAYVGCARDLALKGLGQRGVVE